MTISVNNETINVGEFRLVSSLSSEIADFFEPLSQGERFALLSSLIEIGWVASKVGKNRVDLDYYEKITNNWARSLSDKFQEQGNNLFEDFKRDFFEEIHTLKNAVLVQKDVNHKITELEDRTTIKGLTFETDVDEILSHIASHRSGTVEYVGTTPGISGSKKGDFIYKDGVITHIVAIEAKDLTSKISVSKIEELITETIENRGATSGIFVVKNSSCLPDCFKDFYIGHNYIACTISNLDIAIRASAIFAKQERLAQIEQKQIEDFLSSLVKEITVIDEIIKSATASKKASLRAESAAKDLKDTLNQKISNFTEGAI